MHKITSTKKNHKLITNLLYRMYYTLSSIFVKHTNLYNIEYVSSEGKCRSFGSVNTLFSTRGTRRVTHVKQYNDKSYPVFCYVMHEEKGDAIVPRAL